MKGFILLNAYSRIPQSDYQAKRLKDEFAVLGVSADVFYNDLCALYTDGGGKLVNNLNGYDFCIYLDKDKYASEMLEKSGLRLFNSHAAIQACDDKMVTHILLSDSGVKMPATISGLLCYTPDVPLNLKFLEKVERILSYPIIVKTCHGSLGKGVFKADDRESLIKIAEELKCEPHLFQECIKESLGRDLRVILVGGKVVAAMQRKSDNDFRSNIGLGGKGEKIEPDEELKAVCEKCAKILALDYCGIDVLLGKDGYTVCEVNSNAFFDGIEKVSGVNVAKAYAEYVYGQVRQAVTI